MSKNLRSYSFLVRLLCSCALTIGLTSALVAQSAGNAPAARVLITRPIDSSRLHTLAGNTRSEANAQNDRGKVADTFAMHHMLLQLQRSPEREQALRNFIDRTTRFHLAQFPQMADGGSIRPNIRTGAAGYRDGFRLAALQRFHGEHRVSERHVD